jgi:hypothetical protein
VPVQNGERERGKRGDDARAEHHSRQCVQRGNRRNPSKRGDQSNRPRRLAQERERQRGDVNRQWLFRHIFGEEDRTVNPHPHAIRHRRVERLVIVQARRKLSEPIDAQKRRDTKDRADEKNFLRAAFDSSRHHAHRAKNHPIVRNALAGLIEHR